MIASELRSICRRTGVLASIVTFLSIGLATTVAAQSERKSYRVSIAGFPVGTAQYDAKFNGSNYEIEGFMGSTGFFGAFLASRYSGAVVGSRSGDTLVPRRFRGRFEQSRKFAEVDVVYSGGRPTEVTRRPNRPRLPHEVNPSTVRSALDPISALYYLLRDVPKASVCTQNFRVFEGARTSRLRLQPGGSEGEMIVCNGEYRRLEGFTETQMADRVTFPFQLTYVPTASGDYEVQEFLATTFWGVAKAVKR